MQDTLNLPMQLSIHEVRRLGSNAGFAASRNLCDHQDHVKKVLAHRLVDGALQKLKIRKSFGCEQRSSSAFGEMG